MKSIKRWLPSSAATVLLMGTLVGTTLVGPILSPRPAIAQESQLRTLTVTGQGEVSIPTTKAQVMLGVEAQGSDAQAVQQEVAQRSAAVVELLRSRNVEKLQTTGVRLTPRYNYDNGRSDIIGYSGSNTVSFELNTDQVGTLLDDAIKAGANQIQNVSFIADDAAIATARQQALKQATNDAQVQANAVLSALDLGPKEVVSIQIDGAMPPMPIPLPARAELANVSADASTPVIGGEQTVNARVTLQIRY